MTATNPGFRPNNVCAFLFVYMEVIDLMVNEPYMGTNPLTVEMSAEQHTPDDGETVQRLARDVKRIVLFKKKTTEIISHWLSNHQSVYIRNSVSALMSFYLHTYTYSSHYMQHTKVSFSLSLMCLTYLFLLILLFLSAIHC